MVHTMKTVAGISAAPRRQHDRAFKADLVEQCLAPGASVAAVALAGGVNANLLFKWRREYLRAKQLNRPASSSSTVLVPAQVATPASAVVPQRSARSTGIIELDIAGAVLRLRGPVDEVSLCSVLRALRQSI